MSNSRAKGLTLPLQIPDLHSNDYFQCCPQKLRNVSGFTSVCVCV